MIYQIIETAEALLTPITAVEFREHARFSETTEDALITSYIKAATYSAEKFTRRAFMKRTFKMLVDDFAASKTITFPKSPLISVESIKYYDTNGIFQTLDASKYIVEHRGEPGRIVLAHGEIWPLARCNYPNAVEIEFTAGYGDTTDLVPDGIKAALKFYVSHYFEKREPGDSDDMPLHVKSMLFPYRVL